MKNGLILSLLLASAFSHALGQRQFCTSVIPNCITSLDTTNFRGLADNYFLWNNGQRISVKFLSGSKSVQQKVFAIASGWEKYANIHFVYVTAGFANIRINLDSKGGHNSLVGTLANAVPQNKRTMNLDTTDFVDEVAIRRVVLHEFGHVLGLLHEHFSPLSGISWNKENVYNELYSTNSWDRATVDINIFQKYNISYTNGTLYDPRSIMHYPIPATWTTNNYSVEWNNDLSEGDKLLIEALYPFNGIRQREVPRFQITSVLPLEIVNSSSKKGLSIYPKFTLTTAGKEGIIYFVVSFYDLEGSPIKVEGSEYDIEGVAGTFKMATVPPNMRLQANNGKHDLELFIPYSAFKFPEGNNTVEARFSVLLYDNSEYKLLSSSNPAKCTVVK